MKTLKSTCLILLVFLASALSAQTDKATTARILEAQQYKFVATTAFPLDAAALNTIMNRMPGYTGAGNINLTGAAYDLRITKDSISAYLPFYGRSYTAKIGDSSDSGIKFKSKSFQYRISPRKRGGWDILIHPEDTRESYRMNLTVTPNGYGTLTVNSANQQSITFSGYLAVLTPAGKP